MTTSRRVARAVLLLLIVGAWLLLAAARGRYFDPPRAGSVDVDSRALVVLDGDTVSHRGRELRFLAIDTPERAAPWFDGDQEPWAGRARAVVERALAGAERVTILRSGAEDARGRELVHLLVDGRSVSALIAEAGLGYETVSSFGDGGFPELAAEVVAKARRELPFERPWRWRRVHRIESR